MNKQNQHLVLIDGYGFVFRAFHAFPPLTRDDGTPVGAIYGFTSMLIRVILEFSCSHLAVVLDSGGKTFRHDIFPEYKSHRPPAPESLKPQFPLVRESVSALNIDILEQQGFEADDLIATFAKQASNKGIRTTIISSDKDLMQLIDDNISLYDPIKSKYISFEQVKEKFNVKPEQVVDLLALVGDTADYVPGVSGIGPKTAAELINAYHSLDGIYQNIDKIPASKRKDSLVSNKDLAYLSQKLVILDDQVHTKFNLDDLRIKISHVDQFKEFLKKQNFNSLYARAEKICNNFNSNNADHHDPLLSSKIIELNKAKDLSDWLEKRTTSSGQLCLIMEAGFLCLAANAREIVIVNIVNDGAALNLFENKNGLTLKEISKILEPFLNDTSITKIMHDAKRFYHVISSYCTLEKQAWHADDMQLISYVLNNGVHAHDLKTLVQTYFSLENDLELNKWLSYACLFMLQLHSQFKQRLAKEKSLVLYEKIEKPLSLVLYNAEKNGIKINPTRFKEISTEFTSRSIDLENEIYNLAGMNFNIASPKQLGEVLFEKLQLNSSIKTAKNKNLSTNADVLEELASQGHKIAELILDWRHLTKLNNTYTDNLAKMADNSNRIHTSFQMTVTSTGRLSSANPNLQNIPTKTEDGIKIRSAFIAEENHQLISVDYSQIELRLLAAMANIPSLQEAFVNNQDIHAITASEVFNIDLASVTSDLRRQAKAINFGIIYGQTGFGLANNLRISKTEANKYIETYFAKYPGIREYLEKTKEFARINGYIETLFGRRCYIKAINDSNMALRNFAERAAINAPLQGTAADIIKKAMIALNKELEEQKLPAKILLQIHDELIIEVPNSMVKRVSELTRKIMESIVALSVPLKVDITNGDNWALI